MSMFTLTSHSPARVFFTRISISNDEKQKNGQKNYIWLMIQFVYFSTVAIFIECTNECASVWCGRAFAIRAT